MIDPIPFILRARIQSEHMNRAYDSLDKQAWETRAKFDQWGTQWMANGDPAFRSIRIEGQSLDGRRLHLGLMWAAPVSQAFDVKGYVETGLRRHKIREAALKLEALGFPIRGIYNSDMNRWTTIP